MKKVAAALALVLASSACLVPADDTGETAPVEPDPVAEASAAFTTNKPGLDPEAAKWIDENVPKWDVYLGGKGRDLHPGRDPWSSFTSVYYDDPRDSDTFAPILLVRKGDEGDPSRWVQLSLTQHWMKGDRYFDELIECGTLTMMDLVVVMSELARYADSYIEPSPVYVLEAATPQALRELRYRSRVTCKDGTPPKPHAFAGMKEGPYGPPLPPGWVENPGTPPYGPGPMGSVDGNGHPVPSDPTSTRPSLSQAPPNPAPPRTAEQNGVFPGAPKPKPSPFDEDYEPRAGEVKETFKCSGEVFYGYKAACVELANKSAFEKWCHIAQGWAAGQSATIHEWWTKEFWPRFVRANFNDGKNPECTKRCNRISANLCGIGVFMAGIAITAATRGKVWTTPQGGIGSATGGYLLGTHCADIIREYCAEEICIR